MTKLSTSSWRCLTNVVQVAQVVAHELGVSVDMVAVKGSDTNTCANNMVTGGSVTSESCAKVRGLTGNEQGAVGTF